MKLRSPWLIRLLAFLGAWLIRCWMSTIRFRIFFADGAEHPTDPRKKRCIYAFWHETILFPVTFRGRYSVLISQSRDGELIAQACRFLGYSVVRGSSSNAGGAALIQLHRESKSSHLFVTPDGPRGPRRRVHPGLIFLASLTGLPIVCVGIGYSKAWRARSWDRFAVPLPWTSARCVVSPDIVVPPRIRREEIPGYVRLVEERFLQATAAAERWAEGGPRPAANMAWDQSAERRAIA